MSRLQDQSTAALRSAATVNAVAGGTKSRGAGEKAALKPAIPLRANAESARLLLFVRPSCPACPSAKEAAGQLGIPVDLVNADTEAGLAEAARRNVLSTPTAILLSACGEELDRAWDSGTIASFKNRVAS
jgi:glutaredoxin